MGDVDEGDAQLLLDALELILHVLAQPQVQGPQGLVQQQHLGSVHQGPGDGHPLLLAAGELVDAAVLKALEAHHFQHLQHPLSDLRLGDLYLDLLLLPILLHRLRLADAQAEGHVLKDVQVGEEGVALEDRVHLPQMGRNVIHPHPVEQHFARSGRNEAANDAQGGGLAAATGSEQCEEFTVIEV